MDFVESTVEADGERLACTVVEPDAPAGPDGPAPVTALLMHGAGSGDRHRCLPLARELASAGCRAVVFDFAGHGASTGVLGELSLARRARQARAVLDRHAPDGPLLLVGFSMSGQTVADLLRMPELAARTTAIALGAPAAYAREIHELPFAAPEFTNTLRTEGSWRSSRAFDALAAFGGRAVLVLPETDGVIPAEVTEALDATLRTRPASPPYARLTLPGADHLLGRWLGEHPQECARVAAALLGGAVGAGTPVVPVDPTRPAPVVPVGPDRPVVAVGPGHPAPAAPGGPARSGR
ncbi:alpha/beta fold hydrolase [Kitasatospora sp. NPDC090308]|uniref:alpha/beta fold hydrolase n=1 Tax=Kitasatospora sp. NPDC090308 TaxID=3364082 RepID=UPI0037F43FC8